MWLYLINIWEISIICIYGCCNSVSQFQYVDNDISNYNIVIKHSLVKNILDLFFFWCIPIFIDEETKIYTQRKAHHSTLTRNIQHVFIHFALRLQIFMTMKLNWITRKVRRLQTQHWDERNDTYKVTPLRFLSLVNWLG